MSEAGEGYYADGLVLIFSLLVHSWWTMNPNDVIRHSLFLSMICCPGHTEPQSACYSGPCMNGGQCIDISYPGGPHSFKCSCKEGYDGLTCQRQIDPCAEDPCLNGGICTPRGEHYHCMCLEAYIGKNCETPVVKKDPCNDKPCGPNGVCEVVNSQFVCECLPGFKGPKCETPETEVTVVTNPPDDDDLAWIVEDFLIVIIFFMVLFAAILLFLCIHCYRVWNKRSEEQNIQKTKRSAGIEPGPMKGWLELSNQLCYDCMCWCFKKKQPPEEMVTTCYVDPHGQQVVPMNDYSYCPPVQMKQMQPVYSHAPAPNYVILPREEPRYTMPTYYNNRCYNDYDMPPCVPRSSYRCERVCSPVPARSIPVCCEPTCSIMPTMVCKQPMYRDMCNNQKRQVDDCRTQYQPMRSGSRMFDGNTSSQHNFRNDNVNEEPEYYEGRRARMPDRYHNDNRERRKVTRSELHAQHGKNFPSRQKNWYDHNTSSPGPCYPYPQDMRHGYSHRDPNLDTFIPTNNGTSEGMPCPEYYSNGAPPIPPNTPYPWNQQPYTYPPYAYPYPNHNNIQNNSSSSPAPSVNSQGKVKPRVSADMNDHLRPSAQEKSHLENRNPEKEKAQPMSRGHNISSEDSRMDNLEFVDDDDDDKADRSDLLLTGESEDERRSAFVESETDDTLDRGTIDDDGYGSTNKLSECDVRARNRDPHNIQACLDKSPRGYIQRKQKQRLVKRNRTSPRSQQCGKPGNNSDRKRSKLSPSSLQPYGNQMNNSDYTVSSNYQSSDDSASDGDKEDYHSFDTSGKSGVKTHNEPYRTQQQFKDGNHSKGRLIRRGDLWTNSRPKGLGSQKRLSTARNEDSPVGLLKASSKLERHCPPSAPKKVKGILKNNSHAGNYNRSASSQILRKPKEINMNRSNSRHRSMRYREESGDTE